MLQFCVLIDSHACDYDIHLLFKVQRGTYYINIVVLHLAVMILCVYGLVFFIFTSVVSVKQ